MPSLRTANCRKITRSAHPDKDSKAEAKEPEKPTLDDGSATATGKDDPTNKPPEPPNGKKALLTVVLTGDGGPVADAEVQLAFPGEVGHEVTLPTNRAGEVTFSSETLGAARIRVLGFLGWKSVLKDVDLKKGPQRLVIDLEHK